MQLQSALWKIQEFVLAQQSQRDTDVCLVGSDRKIIRVHKIMFANASKFCQSVFQDGGHDEEIVIILPDYSEEDLISLVTAVYTGSACFNASRHLHIIELIKILGLTFVVENTEETVNDEPEASEEESNSLPKIFVTQDKSLVLNVKIRKKCSSIKAKATESLLKINQTLMKKQNKNLKHTEQRLTSDLGQISSRLQRFICNSCGKTFSRKNDLNRHYMLHSGERKYCCSFCDVKFVSSGDLYKHIRSHTGEKPYPCTFNNCTKTFSQKGDLNKHMKIHLNEKKYQCTECYYKCIQSTDLKNHMLVHSGILPFQCDICPKAYRRKSQLKAHNKKLHRIT